MSIVTSSLTYFPDPTQGKPLFNGYIYVGEPDLDPKYEANQKQVTLRLEDGATVDVGQPLRTGSGGVILYNNAYAVMVVEGDFSLRADNSNGKQVLYIPNNENLFDALNIGVSINGLERDSLQSYLENKEVPDYATLRALPSAQLADGDKIWVEGFPDAWERKTGTATDNGWNIVANDNANVYYESTAPYCDVMIFGAVGDAVFDTTWSGTDDSAAIQNADNQAVISNKEVFFPELSYFCESQIVKSRQTQWRGVSGKAGTQSTFEYRTFGSTLVSGITTSDALVFIDNPTTASNFNPHAGIRDMSFQGDLAQNNVNSAIYIDVNIRWQLLDNIVIKHFNRGIEAVTTGLIFGQRLVTSHCKWTLYMIDCSDCWFNDCHFGSSVSSVVDEDTYFGQGNSGVFHHGGQNIRFQGCRLQVQWRGAGGHFIGTRNLKFDNTCEFDLNGRQGLLLVDCSDVAIMGDFFKNNNENNVVSPSPGTKWSHIQIQSAGETFTANPTTDQITVSGTYRYRGTRCQFSSSGTLPGGLSPDTVYWLGYDTLTTKTVYTNERDLQSQTNPVTITDSGTGTHYLHQYSTGLSVSATINGLKGQPEDAGACVFFRGVDTDAATIGGIIDGVTISGCGEMSADYVMEADRDGTASAIGSELKNISFDGNVTSSTNGLIQTADWGEFDGEVKIGTGNTGYTSVYELADGNYGWFSANGVKTITANDAITALRFVTLNNEGAYNGQVVTVFRKGAGASNVAVRDDSLATLVNVAVDEKAEFVYFDSQWYWNGTVSI